MCAVYSSFQMQNIRKILLIDSGVLAFASTSSFHHFDNNYYLKDNLFKAF